MPHQSSTLFRFWQLCFWLSVVVVAATMLWSGWQLRRQTFDLFDAIHFENDIRRGSMWGMISTGPEGVLNQYDKMAEQADHWDEWREWLDYAPLRLMVMHRWAAWIRATYPEVVKDVGPNGVYATIVPPEDRGRGDPWHLEQSYRFHRPLLLFNATMDAVAAAAAFFLTRLWVRRSSSLIPGTTRATMCGTWQGLAAAGLLWFSPTILIDAYAWPTWDGWILPFFLLSALLASLNWWFCAGLILGIGAMFKGQQLAVAPALVAWALVAGGPKAVLRTIAGGVFAIGLIVAPWTLSHLPADVLQNLHEQQVGRPIWRWPKDAYVISRQIDWLAIACIGAVVLAMLALLRRKATWLVAGVLGGALIVSPLIFRGSSAWWTCAFHFGQVQFPEMIYGPASNLPAILQLKYDWPASIDATAFVLPVLNEPISTKWLFNGSYTVLLVAVGLITGLHARTRDRRILIAIALPWLLFFMLTVALHERYLLFAAGAASICVGYGVGPALLGVLLSIASAIMTMHQMFGTNSRVQRWGERLTEAFPGWFTPNSGRKIEDFIEKTHPDMAWGLLMILAVYLYLALPRQLPRQWPRDWKLLARLRPGRYTSRPAIEREPACGMPQDHAPAETRPADDVSIRPVSLS